MVRVVYYLALCFLRRGESGSVAVVILVTAVLTACLSALAKADLRQILNVAFHVSLRKVAGERSLAVSGEVEFAPGVGRAVDAELDLDGHLPVAPARRRRLDLLLQAHNTQVHLKALQPSFAHLCGRGSLALGAAQILGELGPARNFLGEEILRHWNNRCIF